jgi:gamma-glutamylputrescine oxidase
MFPETPLQCWDSDLVYSYWRLTGDRRLLLGGGSALTTFSKDDVTSDRVIGKVVRDFKMHFPEVCGLHFMQFWPGRIDTTRDLIPTVLRDPKNPWAHFVLGCVGLPWATFCGDFVAGQILGDAADREQVYYQYFSDDRRFFVPLAAERLMGKRLVFSLNNAWAKYYQVDRRPIQGPAPSAERTVSLVKESGTAEIQSPPRAERKAP